MRRRCRRARPPTAARSRRPSITSLAPGQTAVALLVGAKYDCRRERFSGPGGRCCELCLDAYGQDMCFTSELSVRFLRPVPLHQSATFEVSLDGIDGVLRKASGRASVGGLTCAEATAVLAVKRPR